MRNILLLSLLILFVSCSKTDTKTNVPLEVHGNWTSERGYANSYFDVEIEIPETWYLQKGKPERLSEDASEFLAGEDKNLKSSIKSAVDETFSPFWAYRHPPGTPGKTNPNVTFLIENVMHLPGVQTGGDYLLLLEDTLKLSNKEIVFTGTPQQIVLADSEYFSTETKIPMGEITITTQYFAKKKGEYILLIATNYISGMDEVTLAEAFDSIKSTKS